MTDREKTINGINKILGETDKYDGVLWDVLELLKEQGERIKELELEKERYENPDMMGKW